MTCVCLPLQFLAHGIGTSIGWGRLLGNNGTTEFGSLQLFGIKGVNPDRHACGCYAHPVTLGAGFERRSGAGSTTLSSYAIPQGILHIMTWHQHRIWIVALLIVSGLALAWFLARTFDLPYALRPIRVYTNAEYGFVVSYPETALLEESFTRTYHLADTWRVDANPEAAGELIIAIVAYSTESDHSYPRYYHALVRIGASADPDEIARCERVTPYRGETPLPDRVIGGRAWKAFSFDDAGMSPYVDGVSYRQVHEGKCFAIEKIAVRSGYREDPESPDEIPDELLAERYEGLDSIVQSFSFTRP